MQKFGHGHIWLYPIQLIFDLGYLLLLLHSALMITITLTHTFWYVGSMEYFCVADLNLLVFEPLGMIESRIMKNEILGMEKNIKIIDTIFKKIIHKIV